MCPSDDVSADARLLSVASSIADGRQVDWTCLQNLQNEPPRSAILSELAVLEQIAAFHRGTEPSGTPTAEHRDSDDNPRTWGHFKILERLGQGAFGTVYRAQNQKLQSEVALKLLWPSTGGREPGSASILKEARLLAKLRHPNVVTVHGTDYIDGRVGIWMELLSGRTLASLLRDHGPFGAREAAGIGIDLCRALAAVHRAGILHGDVKAHNVIREQGGRTVLTDFGTGKDLVDDAAGPQSTPDFAGTPLYVAPEVFEGRPRTKLADIYSLGVLLYHLVTASYPVEGRTRLEVADAHRRGERTHLRDASPNLPPEFVAVVEKALAVEPKDRYQSAGAFEAALAPIVGYTPDTHSRTQRVPMAASVAALVVAGSVAYCVSSPRFTIQRQDETPVRAVSGSSRSAPTRRTDVEPSYQIDTALYRMRGGTEDRLRAGGRVGPGDTLFVRVRVSVPAYVYIVNEDDQGESYLLFPLPRQALANPLAPGTTHRIPGTTGGELMNWQVTSAGGREHFLIFVSPERLPAFEQMFDALPRPELGKRLESAPLSPEVVGHLRSVGGLTASPAHHTSMRLSDQFATPLGEAEETAHGLWVRQFTVSNPR